MPSIPGVAVPGRAIPGFMVPGYPAVVAPVTPHPVTWVIGMTSQSIPSGSTEYVSIPVRAYLGGQAYDPTSDTVSLAFVPLGFGEPSSWNAGIWSASPNGTPFYAQYLVGASSLAVGTYAIWVKITDSPTVPVRIGGTLTITT
jgi:hypothetical protein